MDRSLDVVRWEKWEGAGKDNMIFQSPDSFVQFSNSFNITIKIIFNIKQEQETIIFTMYMITTL